MANLNIRLSLIEINNFKNVVHGILNFDNPRKAYGANILGLYGQNGSGKTALIDALHILKYALSGQQLLPKYCELIHVDSPYASFRYELDAVDPENEDKYRIRYEFKLKKMNKEVENTDLLTRNNLEYAICIFDEILSYSCNGSTLKQRMMPVVDAQNYDVFGPTTKFSVLTGTDADHYTDLLVEKRLAALTSRSFIFSRKLINLIKTECNHTSHKRLFENLVYYGNYNLFVIDMLSQGLISLDTLPLTFKYEEEGIGAVGDIHLSLKSSTPVPTDAIDVVESVLYSMNIVLSQIVPGLQIGIKHLKPEMAKDGSTVNYIQLISKKNKKEIPLHCESEGIKKIISILNLLIAVYNRKSVTVAIDELDNGIFEYLLGELLQIIAEKGQGQLIFTSHNLRPLETLDRGFIAFTTVNPSNRYIRLSNVKSNNNLRDFYYRDILLGEQSESIYEATNNFEIALAFKEAGIQSGA